MIEEVEGRGSMTVKVKIIKDEFFATRKWFIVDPDNGFKWNQIGYKTKKAAVDAAAACDARVIK